MYNVVTFACCMYPQIIVQFSLYITDVPNSPLCLTWCKAVLVWTLLCFDACVGVAKWFPCVGVARWFPCVGVAGWFHPPCHCHRFVMRHRIFLIPFRFLYDYHHMCTYKCLHMCVHTYVYTCMCQTCSHTHNCMQVMQN